MTLASQTWLPCTRDHMIHSFLSAEAFKVPELAGHERLLSRPDFEDTKENRRREDLLCNAAGRRAEVELPAAGTRWSRVKHLRDEHLCELRLFGNFHGGAWPDARLPVVAAAFERLPLRDTDPDAWAPPILYLDVDGVSYLVLEGSHRLVWYQQNPSELRIPVIVGVSPWLSKRGAGGTG